jgi:hypothetical protein
MEVDPAFGYWFAGLVDGEGCFVISRRRRTGSRRSNFGCEFIIQLRLDDLPVLLECQERLGGKIRHVRNARGNSHPIARWVIQKKADCRQLCDVLETYELKSKKRRDFLIWSRAVDAQSSMQSGTPSDFSEMEALYRELRAVRGYVEPAAFSTAA